MSDTPKERLLQSIYSIESVELEDSWKAGMLEFAEKNCPVLVQNLNATENELNRVWIECRNTDKESKHFRQAVERWKEAHKSIIRAFEIRQK